MSKKNNKIALTINVTPEEVEMANFFIAQFYLILKKNVNVKTSFNITDQEMELGMNFRQELLDKLFSKTPDKVSEKG